MEEGRLIRQDFDREVPALPIEELQRLQSDYPYFQAARFLYLKKLRHDFPERYERALQENALYAGDRKSLFYLLEGAAQSWSRLYPDEEKEATNDAFALIDSFLSSHTSKQTPEESSGPGSPVSEVAYRLEDIPVAPEAADGEGGSFALIDTFLEKSSGREDDERNRPVVIVQNPENESSSELQDDEFLTESLAKIYIKQRRYKKALEIIRKLSLKYPEKNIYFADQIRFLEKLIINIKSE